MNDNLKLSDTREVKAHRERALCNFLENIKTDGSWRHWLNKRTNELHVARVCTELGKNDCGKPWDGSLFRGANWGVTYKNDFNQWVKSQLNDEQLRSELNQHGDQIQQPHFLPTWIADYHLPDKVTELISDVHTKNRHLQTKIAALENQLHSKDRRILELQVQLESVENAFRAKNQHYMLSIRSLSYDD